MIVESMAGHIHATFVDIYGTMETCSGVTTSASALIRVIFFYLVHVDLLRHIPLILAQVRASSHLQI